MVPEHRSTGALYCSVSVGADDLGRGTRVIRVQIDRGREAKCDDEYTNTASGRNLSRPSSKRENMSKRPAANRSAEREFSGPNNSFDRVGRGRRLQCTFSHHPTSVFHYTYPSATFIAKRFSGHFDGPVERGARTRGNASREERQFRAEKNSGRNLRKRLLGSIESLTSTGHWKSVQSPPVSQRIQKKLCCFTFLTGSQFSLVTLDNRLKKYLRNITDD